MTSFNVWIRDLGNKQEIIGKDLALKNKVLRKLWPNKRGWSEENQAQTRN